MRLGTHHIGTGEPPFIIAEIGVNHNGRVDTARRLIDAAALAGADAVKFQFFTAEQLLSSAARLASYQQSGGAVDPFSMLERLQLSVAEMGELVEYSALQHILPLVTVFSLEHVAAMKGLSWAGYKVASPDIINRPLLEAVAKLGTPMILSTGAADMQEVRRALTWVSSAKPNSAANNVALMQCVSCYPTPTASATLAPIVAMHKAFNVPVGYSDHTTDERTGGLAVAAGAVLLEKHITLNRSRPGPDHAMSLEPDQFSRYVKFSRLAGSMLVSSEKAALEIEQDVRSVARQSIVATKTLHPGHVLTRSDLTIKRPGTGLAPELLDDLIGQVIATTVEANHPLMPNHLRLQSAESHRFTDRFPAADAA